MVEKQKSQIKFGAILSYVSIAVNIIAGLLYTPWMVNQIGGDDYGLFTIVNSLITLFMVDFGLRRGRRIRRIYLYISVPDRLHKHGSLHHIGIGLYDMEILGKSNLVRAASLVGVEEYCILLTAPAVHIESKLRNLPHVTEVSSGLDGPCKFEHRPLTHTVTKPVRSAVDKY